jgi:hypothetical protein
MTAPPELSPSLLSAISDGRNALAITSTTCPLNGHCRRQPSVNRGRIRWAITYCVRRTPRPTARGSIAVSSERPSKQCLAVGRQPTSPSDLTCALVYPRLPSLDLRAIPNVECGRSPVRYSVSMSVNVDESGRAAPGHSLEVHAEPSESCASLHVSIGHRQFGLKRVRVGRLSADT